MGVQQRIRGGIPSDYLVVIAAAAVAWATFGACASASARSPSFNVQPKGLMQPDFGKRKHDYAVRCRPKATELHVEGAKGWRIRIGHGSFRRRDIVKKLRANSEVATDVVFHKANGKQRRTYHLRCLPGDFPEYGFHRDAPGGPKLFTLQLGNYATIIDRNGVPVWWYRSWGSTYDTEVLRDGTVAFEPIDPNTFELGNFEIHSLNGRLIRVVKGAGGATTDQHEILLMPNGNYMVGTLVEYEADTSSFGGTPDSTVTGVSLQEVTPEGDLVWHWDSREHIGLEETGRWWDDPFLDTQPYDVVHWNSAERVGKRYLLLSFRHLDAVYEIDRRTGDIVWKLGGTETPESLDVRNDPHGDYPLGGQHDARVLPDGTVSIHDNRTGLDDPPRAVRYRISRQAGTARLVQSIADPHVKTSFCCGSARRLNGGDWLVGWGGDGRIGAYDRGGNRLFKLWFESGFSYRAIPVPGSITVGRIRAGMDAMATR
jgi:hypothetical protein